MFRNVFGGCVSDRSSQADVYRSQKLKFGASLSSALKHGYLPLPLVEMLVYIAKEGTATADVFRRPGNPNDTRRIVKHLTEGKQVIYSNYSFYTLASVVKKFLLKIPGGVLTPEGERQLLQVLTLNQKMDQIEAVHSFMDTLAPAHQQLIALLFGTWFRIVTYQDQNCMSVEALSRSVAGSMFHTCAEDPAKVEKASRIMQFLIDNFGDEAMFGPENLQYFVDTTHTGLHLPALYHCSYVPDTQSIPSARPDFIEVQRFEREEIEEVQKQTRKEELSESLPVEELGHSRDFQSDNGSQLMINTSTLSAPVVSLIPSPDVSKRPKSLEDCLNEVRSHYQSRCLSRYNSVKRKQLERLRQRSDWFLSPVVRERNNSRKEKQDMGLSLYSNNNVQSSNQNRRGNGNNNNNKANGNNSINYNNKIVLHQKISGNSTITKSSSENAVGENFSDADSIFTDATSRSESPASEPAWSHGVKVHSRDVVHSDTIEELEPLEMNLYQENSSVDLSFGSHDSIGNPHLMELSPLLVRSSVVEEEEEDVRTNEDEDENTTPTEGQEEEDVTLMTSSIPDLQIQSIVDEDLTQGLESCHEPVTSVCNESVVELKLNSNEGVNLSKLQQADVSMIVDLGAIPGDGSVQRQHFTQGLPPDERVNQETEVLAGHSFSQDASSCDVVELLAGPDQASVQDASCDLEVSEETRQTSPQDASCDVELKNS